MLNALALNSLSRVSTTLQSLYQMRMNKIHLFKRRIALSLDVGPYHLKTIESVEDLKATLRFRHEILWHEFGGRGRGNGVDVDEHDFASDHLVMTSVKTGRILAAYRLQTADDASAFQTSRDFNLQRLMTHGGTKTELGRACVRAEVKNSFTYSLLWKGVSEYMSAAGSTILFGSTSIRTRSPREAALLYRFFFEEGRMNSRYFTPPTRASSMADLDLWIRYFRSPLTTAERAEVDEVMPSFCRSYLRAGALIGGEPAWNDDLKCIDFLTILHREDLNRSLWQQSKDSSGRFSAFKYS